MIKLALGSDILNQLFTNNVDFVAKQMQVFIDALFPSNEDNSETPFSSSACPVCLTGQIQMYTSAFVNNTWYDDMSYYSVNFNSASDSNALTFLTFSENADSTTQSVLSSVANNSYFKGNLDTAALRVGFGTGSLPRPILDLGTQSLLKFEWGCDLSYATADKFTNIYLGNPNFPDSHGSLYRGYSSGYLYFLQNDGNRLFILTDDTDGARTIYNNINYNNDYHTSNTFNFNGGSGNGGGDVFVGGGAGGLVVGLAGAVGYADIEFALDSLIHDLNLNFADQNNVLPVNDFPSYDDIKYVDVGDFNITPIEQIKPLPLAPSFEVDLDVGQLPQTIGYSVQSVLDISDAVLGVGGSALLLGSLFFSFLWIKLKRR